MLIFHGKLTLLPHADNETITMVFLSRFQLNDQVSVHWQWSKHPEGGGERSCMSLACIITAVERVTGDYRIKFSAGPEDKHDYSFNGVVAKDNKLTATMRNWAGKYSKTLYMGGPHDGLSDIPYPHFTIYVGKLNYHVWSQGEMMTLVLPAGVSTGAPVGLFYQWTTTATNPPVPKANRGLLTTFKSTVSADGVIKGIFIDYYTYEFTILNDGEAKFRMSANDGCGPDTSTLLRVYTASCAAAHDGIVTAEPLQDHIRELERKLEQITNEQDEELDTAMRRIAWTDESMESDGTDEELNALEVIAGRFLKVVDGPQSMDIYQMLRMINEMVSDETEADEDITEGNGESLDASEME